MYSIISSLQNGQKYSVQNKQDSLQNKTKNFFYSTNYIISNELNGTFCTTPIPAPPIQNV